MSTRTQKYPPARRTGGGLAWLALALVAGVPLLIAAGGSGGTDSADEQPGPREIYNEGTRRLRDGKLNEAEAILQTAVESQDPAVQPLALYNLGQVRFQQGMREYTNAPDSRPIVEVSARASRRAGDAIKAADDALAGGDLQAIVTAYIRGRGARKELRSAMESVKRAMDQYGAVLAKWRRASGDFRSTLELRPSDAAAQTNADVVDRWIAEVVDREEMLMPGQAALQSQLQELTKRLEQMAQSDSMNRPGAGQSKPSAGDASKPGSAPNSGKNGKPGPSMTPGDTPMPGPGEMESLLRQLSERLRQLRDKLPAEMLEQMGQDGSDDDDDNPQPKELKEGQEQGQSQNTRQLQLTRQEALRLLQLLREPNGMLSLRGVPLSKKVQDREGVAAKGRVVRDW